MENKESTANNQEIDLSIVSKAVSSFGEKILSTVVRFILFIKKKFVIILCLFLVGIVLGFFVDKTNKQYDNQIIVTPNLGGVDYLYSKVNLLSSKLIEGDTLFLSSLGVKNVKNIREIKIKPIVDIYGFVNNSTSAANAQNTQNFEMIKLLAEDSNITKVIEDELTGKNFPLHTISIATNSKIARADVINPILTYLNTDQYYNEVLKISESNVRYELAKNEKQIIQIDSIIKKLVVNLGKNKSNSLVYNSENDQLNPMFQLKNELVKTVGNQKIQLIKLNLIIKDVVVIINKFSAKGINGKIKFILPFVLIGLYLFFMAIITFFRDQKIIK
jgi:hypothetical protein